MNEAVKNIMPEVSASRRCHLRTGKFTLIELLTVVAIIMILLGLLMPSLNKARDVARRISCAGKLSQIGKAANMYTTDNSERFPNQATSPVSQNWFAKMDAYLTNYVNKAGYTWKKAPPLWSCPSKAAGMNCFDWNQSSYAYSWKGGGATNCLSYSIVQQVKSPSLCVMLADCFDDYGIQTPLAYESSIFYKGQNWNLPDLGNRHSQGANICFVDAHILWMPKTQADSLYPQYFTPTGQ